MCGDFSYFPVISVEQKAVGGSKCILRKQSCDELQALVDRGSAFIVGVPHGAAQGAVYLGHEYTGSLL